MATRNLAIMFTDIQGFTARTSVSTREGIDKLLDAHDRLLKPVFATFRGTIVKTIGDAFLVWFESPTDAVICGLTVQEVLRQRNERVPAEERLHVRVAINAGDVELRTDEKTGMVDVFGEPVNLAARLEGITEAGEVWFTEAVYLTMNRAEAPSTEIGERTFKGIPNPVRVYKVIYEPGSEHARALAARVKFEGDGRPSISREVPVLTEMRGRPAPRRRGKLFAGIAAVALLVTAVAYGQWRAKHPPVRGTLFRAKKALQAHDDAQALALLSRAPQDNPAVRDLARVAIDDELAARAKKNEAAAATFAWLNALQTAHPPLQWLVDEKRPALEVTALVWKLTKDGATGEEFWKPLRDLFERYPDNPDVHLAAADAIVATQNWGSNVGLWLYAEAVKRGRRLDGKVFDQLVDVFSHFTPEEGDAKDARDLADRQFHDRLAAWAKETADKGEAPVPFRNALAWARDAKDPLADRPDVKALDDLLQGNDMPAAKKTLAAEKDPARKARAVAMLTNAADHFSFPKSNRLDVIAAANAIAGKTVAKP